MNYYFINHQDNWPISQLLITDMDSLEVFTMEIQFIPYFDTNNVNLYYKIGRAHV